MQKIQIDVEKVIREYIADIYHLSLATSINDTPWVCELHFAYDENLNLYFRSLASRRHSLEIAQNPHIAGNIIKQHALSDTAVGVYFEGSARILNSDEDIAYAAKYIGQRMGVGDEIIEEAKKVGGHKFYKISVKNWYVFGRFGLPHGQKHKLEWNKS